MNKAKKLIALALCMSSLFCATANASKTTSNDITNTQSTSTYTQSTVLYNGQNSNITAYIENGKILVPIEETAKTMQLEKVEYYPDSNCYLISDGLHLVAVYMDNTYTIVDEFGYYTAIAPRFIDGTAYMYLDVLTEAFGASYSDNGFNIQLKHTPKIGKINLNGKIKTLNNKALLKEGKLLLPIEETAKILRLSYAYYEDSNCFMLEEDNGKILVMYLDNTYTIVDNYGYYTSVAPQFIDGVAYAYADVITQAFGAELIVSGTDVSINYDIYTPEESFINNSGKSSQTDYLIWVSKKDFRVHVFYGKQGDWELLRSLKCSIGAPGTPTCEGTYRFYERINKWDYGSYYVGPVMRFNGGYALHSTIVNNNGTLRDGRLEKMISHGCVRIAPDEMNWLFATIPLYTTVYVTP